MRIRIADFWLARVQFPVYKNRPFQSSMVLRCRRSCRRTYVVVSLIVIAATTIAVYKNYTQTPKRRDDAATRSQNFVRQLLLRNRDKTPPRPRPLSPPPPLPSLSLANAEQADVIVNGGETTVAGLRKDGNFYVPVDFVGKYFDVYAKENRIDYSYSTPKRPTAPYNSTGPFLSFAGVEVESRDRVMYISGTDGVTVTSQWDARGHRYPVQISQMCLAHYSKLMTETPKSSSVVSVETGRGAHRWTVRNDEQMFVRSARSRQANQMVVEFNTHAASDEDGVFLLVNIKPGESKVAVFCVRFFDDVSSALTFQVRLADEEEKYEISYRTKMKNDVPLAVDIETKNISYLIGSSREWRTLARDLARDIQKAFAAASTWQPELKHANLKKKKVRILEVISVVASGHGQIAFIRFQRSEHRLAVQSAADWLIRAQDAKGGWPVSVKRVLSNKLVLSPGWYSAMGQGQAMSCLCRQYQVTKRREYLDAAVRATRPFRVAAADGGVLAKFMGVLPWYEEYPTVPSAFVLNGFIYSLLGLYDVGETAGEEAGREARALFDDGLKSLVTMLPLFDLGGRTSYDLRHVALQSEPRVARWDYHSVHVGQLLYLGTIDKSRSLWNATAERWERYMHGYRAEHN